MSTSSITTENSLNRRQFLTAGGGLLLAFTLDVTPSRPALAQGTTTSQVNAWIRVGSDETVTILIGGLEMGQGAVSGLAQLAAEELMVDWSKVKAEPAPAAQAWVTGGSTNIRGHYNSMRVAAAAAREMLIAAAAQTWSVPASACRASQGQVVNSSSGAALPYSRLAALAATMPVPSNPPLVPPTAFRLIGKPLPRLDVPAKTNGSAVFGIDVRVPGMLYAVIKHCPTVGGTLAATPPVPRGATAVVPLDNAVAVVASTTWQAMRAASQLQVKWTLPAGASSINSAQILSQAQQLMASGSSLVAEQVGNPAAAFQVAARVVEATYSLPYLAHACMEVLNCTVNPSATGWEIWAPTQAPNLVLSTAMAVTGLPASKITVRATYMGGGLGRKFEQDFVTQAIRVAKAIGKPVKLTWPREEDMAHDQYRPMALARVRAALDAGGNIIGWANRIVSPSILGQRGWIPPSAVDSQAVDGAVNLPYALGSRLVEWVRHPSPVPVGFWRSVGHSINVFVVESALDEVAAATGADPYAQRRKLLAGDPRSLAVLDAAASLGGWGTALPAGHARGIALSAPMGSVVAQVAEVSVPAAGSLTIHKVACAVDCGSAINPNSVEAQMQSGIFHGLSAALWGQVTFNNGQAGVRNFSNYRVLLMREAPVITVQIIQSGAPLGGVGEPGVPAIAPAVANAHARLTGQQVRNLPFFPGARMQGDD